MKDSNSTNLTPLGLDDGHYAIKVCAGKGKYFIIPSMIRSGRDVELEDNGHNNDDLIFCADNNQYYTITAYNSLSVNHADTRDPDFAISNENRALGYYAMNRAAKEGYFSRSEPLFVMSGLPVNRFYTPDGKYNKNFVDLKRKSLFIPISPQSKEAMPKVERHEVVSEAVASFFDAAYDFDGNPNEEFLDVANYTPTAIVDIGGKTLDVAVVKEGGAGLHYTHSGTVDSGALYVHDALRVSIAERLHQLRPDVVPEPLLKSQIDLALQKGFVISYGKRVDVSDIVSRELDSFADRVRSFVQPKLGNGSMYGNILFVGGGANLLHDRVKQIFPSVPLDVITLRSPDSGPDTNSGYSNARGLYKAALISSFA